MKPSVPESASGVCNRRPGARAARQSRGAGAAIPVLAAAVLVSCAVPAPPAPVAAPARFAAVLQPGCLLPPPGLLAQAAVPWVGVFVRVGESGQVLSARLRASTGSPDLDAAMPAAVMKCRFEPAYVVDPSTHARSMVQDTYHLQASWSVPPHEFGPHRCFTPGYPHAALRAEQEGRVIVMFRKNSATGKIDTLFRPDSAPGRMVRDVSLRAVVDCLAHEEVHAGMPMDQWMGVPYLWKLE
jgi:TonB family protein